LESECKVIFNYSSDDQEALHLRNELALKYDSTRLSIIKADLSSIENVEAFCQAATQFSSSIDYLILNTGITDRTEFGNVKYADWQRVMDTNLNIPFFLVQKLSPYLQMHGRIVFIGSIMGLWPHAISLSYGVSKAALHFLARSLVKEFASRLITVNAVTPGFVDTTWQLAKNPEHKKRVETKIALNRFAHPQEVAHLVMSVIQNDYINGAIIPIDGGYCCS